MFLSCSIAAEEPQAQETWLFYNGLQAQLLFASKGNIIIIIMGTKKICLFLRRETLALSSKGLCYTNTLENIVQNKRAMSYSQDVWKHGRFMGNVVPTLLLSEHIVPSPLLSIPYSPKENSLLPLLCPTKLCIYYIMSNMSKGDLCLFILLYQ